MVTALKISIAPAYSFQPISVDSSTPVSRYTSFSIGRNTGSRNVFSRLNTRVMKMPRGLVTARVTPSKRRICNQPFAVMSELLRFQQSDQQVSQEEHANNNEQDISKHPGSPSYLRRSQPRT